MKEFFQRAATIFTLFMAGIFFVIALVLLTGWVISATSQWNDVLRVPAILVPIVGAMSVLSAIFSHEGR